MARVVGVVGSSGAGKTTLVERLVQVLRERGLSVGYLEHAHEGVDLDRTGSDSWRAREAGAEVLVVAGGGRRFEVDSRGDDLPGALAHLARCDVVLAEGYHDAEWPKIVVRRSGVADRAVAPPVLAEIEVDDAGEIDERVFADLTERLAAAIDDESSPDVHLLVDGEAVPLARFATEIVAGTVLGMVETLKGVDDPAVVELVVRRPGG